MQQFRDYTEKSTPIDLPSDSDSFQLVIANPSYSRGLMLFPVGQSLEIKRWGLPWLVTHVTSNDVSATGQRLAEAVAVAGVRAAGDGSPRAVVLVLSDNPIDTGVYEAAAVREYLRGLHVPLVVWSVAHGAAEGSWGPVQNISSPGKLIKATRGLLKDLEKQSVVWVEGRHLPSDIELSPPGPALQLAQ
jgi:hypothetical protein